MNLEYLIQNMIHLVIQILQSMLELIFEIYHFCVTFLCFSMYSKCWGLIKQHVYHLCFKFVLSKSLSNSLWGSDVLLFSEFINIVSILFYNFIEFIILLYTFLVISFVRYRKYINWLISFSKFSDVLPAFNWSSAIGNHWSICLGVNISWLFPYFALYLASDKKKEYSPKKINNFFS